MKKMIILFITILISFTYSNSAAAETNYKLIITNFVEASNLKEAGAMEGDMILSYNGFPVTSFKQLSELKKNVNSEMVEIVLVRGMEEIEVETEKGALGVYLREFAQDHKVLEEAVLIEGIGELGWGIGMENSFLGCAVRLEEKFGNALSYSDLVGLSGYGFRTNFLAGYCPSSPDATVGYDVGSTLLERLGYSVKYIYLAKETDLSGEYAQMSKADMQAEILNSIDQGYPVIAIDLIEIPEWGLITGYQSEGETLFCRTYFDKTQGYETAKKFPWVIVIIEGKITSDLIPIYDTSLDLAYEMYTTESYDKYFSGVKALEEWIEILRRSSFYYELDEKVSAEVFHANWWIFYSLWEAKYNALEYLKKNQGNFYRYSGIISELIDLYEAEVELTGEYAMKMPSPYDSGESAKWGTKNRLEQVKVLKKLLEMEKSVVELLE